MINQTTGQYTFGVPQQNSGYYSSGYGTPGATNHYEQGGSKYVGSMLPSNNVGAVGGLLAETNNVPRPGFNDTDGTPINYSPSGDKSASWYRNRNGDDLNAAAREAALAGDTHAAYLIDTLRWRQQNNIPDYKVWDTSYPGNVELGIPSDQQTLNSAGSMLNSGILGMAGSMLGFNNSNDNATQPWQEMQNTPLPGVMQSMTPMITPIWEPTTFNANKQPANAFNPNEHANEFSTGGVLNAFSPTTEYASPAAHAAAQTVLNSEEKTTDGQYWYI